MFVYKYFFYGTFQQNDYIFVLTLFNDMLLKVMNTFNSVHKCS